MKIHFYDQTFAFLRHKVSIPTIKHFHFYDIKLALRQFRGGDIPHKSITAKDIFL